jgi:hypothetical protein
MIPYWRPYWSEVSEVLTYLPSYLLAGSVGGAASRSELQAAAAAEDETRGLRVSGYA